MRYSHFFLPTVKEAPSDAELASHKLMIRAGMIRKLSSGLYSYLPLGLKTLAKVEQIVREEMDRAGAQEVLLPMVQPAELWQATGRWQQYGKELLRFKDRHEREFCLGPTHEEVITELVSQEVRSYRNLPLNFYQIHTKFRDEIRPRFGLMRGREFVMKDAYSFHADAESLDQTYKAMYDAYVRIFERCGLDFRPVEADTGSIGGHASHEFMVMADAGEDLIAVCTACSYAANVELAQCVATQTNKTFPQEDMNLVSTPNKRTVAEVTAFLGVSAQRLVKTLVVMTEKGACVALLRGDHELNEIKLKKALNVDEIRMATDDEISRLTGAPCGYLGPVGLPKHIKIVADFSVLDMTNFVTGANCADAHLVGVNWNRDLAQPEGFDLRLISKKDPCPRCGARIELKRGIEVGHVFKLGTKYSEALKAYFTDAEGVERPMVMGCYGIGVSRTVAAVVEQRHDENGIIFPKNISPFDCIITVVSVQDELQMKEAAMLYQALQKQGVSVLLDDRDARPGVKFKDADLIGAPLRVTVGKKLKETGELELKQRATGAMETVTLDDAKDRICSMLIVS